MHSSFKFKQNKTGLQPVSRTCGTTPFGFQHCRRKNQTVLKTKQVKINLIIFFTWKTFARFEPGTLGKTNYQAPALSTLLSMPTLALKQVMFYTTLTYLSILEDIRIKRRNFGISRAFKRRDNREIKLNEKGDNLKRSHVRLDRFPVRNRHSTDV